MEGKTAVGVQGGTFVGCARALRAVPGPHIK